ncbi:cobalamin biosynthesis protein CbiG [Sorangium sp. So ce394]|uniref:cobalamin biosynthesis protein CbiG n=1 Tax=Sorangium sp. So ce394 TaxID=3133310 RepID=UPI003F5C184E
MTLFDAYFFVDWSASSAPTRRKPKKDAVWLGELVRGAPPAERYHRTRSACIDDLLRRVRALAADGLRVLIGFDFAYGYPRGLADALGLSSNAAPWARTWDVLASKITDGANNGSNRWRVASELNRALMPVASPVGPFWGCPPGAATATLKASKREGKLAFPFLSRAGRSLPEWRHAEARARSKNPSVQSTWKLFTSGSVGSQALVGIPRVARIRHDAVLAPFSKVWPFETGFGPALGPATGPFVLHAEVWPVLFGTEVEAQIAADRELDILDQAQVRALCAWAERTDAAGELGRFFDRPADLPDPVVQDCVEEEGWILGLP